MPRTKQGIFKKILNESRRLEEDYQKVVAEYGKDPSYIDFFSDLVYSSDSLFKELGRLESDVRCLLESTAMEIKENVKKYQEIQKTAKNQRKHIQRLFRQRVEDIRQSGGYLTDAEQITLDKLSIR